MSDENQTAGHEEEAVGDAAEHLLIDFFMEQIA